MTGRIIEVERNDPRFWLIIGPLCAEPSVRKEVGGPISVLPGDRWFVALGADGQAIACGVLRRGKPGEAALAHAWVHPDHRRNSLHAELLERRIDAAREDGLRKLHTVASPEARSNYERHGFVETGKRGKFTVMILDLAP